MNKKKIKEYIKNLDNLKLLLENLLEASDDLTILSEKKDELKEFTDLRLLAKSSSWPEAIPKDFLCSDNEEDKITRAEGILSNLNISDLDESFLDFGCGEGYVVFLNSKNKKSVGYDITDQNWSHFDKNENLIFSNKWEEIEKNGPYDLILLNDVIDHVENPLKELEKIQKIKNSLTKIFLRVHPWTSRHGSHLYKQLNKAYLHLVFSESELFVMGIEQQKINKVLDPINFYQDLLKKAGFTIVKEEVIKQPVESFFNSENIKSRIQRNYDDKDYEKILKTMEIQFIDFTLL
jgi:2-polyprenyl-3-methyl-5-hydroxy-6-metoxy-1,4-benzoquinol methylase